MEMNLIIVFAFPFLSLLSTSYSTEIHTSCHMPTAVNGRNTTLTCNFGMNVGLFKQDIQIVRQSNPKDEDETRILTCLWDDDVLDCLVDASFKFNNKISDTLELEIPFAEQIHEGIYRCIILGFENEKFETCSFVKQDVSTESSRVEITSSNSKIYAMPSAALTMKGFGAQFHCVMIMVLVCLRISR